MADGAGSPRRSTRDSHPLSTPSQMERRCDAESGVAPITPGTRNELNTLIRGVIERQPGDPVREKMVRAFDNWISELKQSEARSARIWQINYVKEMQEAEAHKMRSWSRLSVARVERRRAAAEDKG